MALTVVMALALALALGLELTLLSPLVILAAPLPFHEADVFKYIEPQTRWR